MKTAAKPTLTPTAVMLLERLRYFGSVELAVLSTAEQTDLKALESAGLARSSGHRVYFIRQIG